MIFSGARLVSPRSPARDYQVVSGVDHEKSKGAGVPYDQLPDERVSSERPLVVPKRLHHRLPPRNHLLRMVKLHKPRRPPEVRRINVRLNHAGNKRLQQPRHKLVLNRVRLLGLGVGGVRRGVVALKGRREEGARLARGQRRAGAAGYATHQADDGGGRLGGGHVGGQHGLEGGVQELGGGLDLEALVEDAEHADEGDELCVEGGGGRDGDLVLLVGGVGGVGHVDRGALQDLEDLEDHLARVPQAGDGLEAGLAAGHVDEHLHEVPADVLREGGILEYVEEGGEDLGGPVLLDYREVGEGVRRGRPGLLEAPDDFGGRGAVVGHYVGGGDGRLAWGRERRGGHRVRVEGRDCTAGSTRCLTGGGGGNHWRLLEKLGVGGGCWGARSTCNCVIDPHGGGGVDGLVPSIMCSIIHL